MAVVLEDAEREPAGRPDALSAGLVDVMPATPVTNDDSRDDRPAVDRHAIQVADAIGIGDERHDPAVGGDLRAEVFAAQERRESAVTAAVGEIEPRQPQRAGFERRRGRC